MIHYYHYYGTKLENFHVNALQFLVVRFDALWSTFFLGFLFLGPEIGRLLGGRRSELLSVSTSIDVKSDNIFLKTDRI